MNKELKVGQVLYVTPIGNATRGIKGGILENIIETKITKIGRKYFYLDNTILSDRKFSIESMYNVSEQNYSSRYKAYTDKKIIEGQ